MRGARPAQPAATAPFPRRPAPASEPAASRAAALPHRTSAAPPLQGKGTGKGQRAARGAGEGGSPRAGGGGARPGDLSEAAELPGRTFRLRATRGGAASLRPTRRDRASEGAHGAPALATAAILAATLPGARGRSLAEGYRHRQTDRQTLAVTG